MFWELLISKIFPGPFVTISSRLKIQDNRNSVMF